MQFLELKAFQRLFFIILYVIIGSLLNCIKNADGAQIFAILKQYFFHS